MTVFAEMEKEALNRADQKSGEVLMRALTISKLGIVSRFTLLRRKKINPVNQEERDYLFALSKYVSYKLLIRRSERISGLGPSQHYTYIGKVRYWRNMMFCIENGMPHPSGSELEGVSTFLEQSWGKSHVQSFWKSKR